MIPYDQYGRPMNPLLRPLIPMTPPAPPAMLPGPQGLTPLVPQGPMLASAIPMLAPGAAPIGDVVGRFPDAQISAPQPMIPAPTVDAPEEPQSGSRVFASMAPDEGGSALPAALMGAGAAPPGLMDRLASPDGRRNALAMLGLSLMNLGQGGALSPVMAKMVMDQRARQDQAKGLGHVMAALSAASQAPTAAQGIAILDEAMRNPAFQSSPEAAKLLIQSRTGLFDRAAKEQGTQRIAGVMRSLPDNATDQQVAQALVEAGIPYDDQAKALTGLFRKRNREATLATGQPASVDETTGRVTTYGPARRDVSGGMVVDPYAPKPVVGELPRTDKMGAGDTLVRTAPGQAPQTLASVPDKQPIAEPVARQLERLGFTVASVNEALANPDRQAMALGVLELARNRAQATEAIPAPSFEALQNYLRANPGATVEQYFTQQRAGIPGSGAAEATRYGAQQQQDRVNVAAATGQGAAEGRAKAEQGIRIGEERAGKYVTMDGRFVAPRTTERDVDAMIERGEAAYVPYQFDREVILRTRPLMGELDRIEGIVQRRPDLFPPSQGMVPDLLSTTMAKAKAAWTAGTDPDVAAIRRGLAPYGPALSRYSGDTGNTALAERFSNLEAFGAAPSTREVATTLIGDLRRLMRDNLANYRLDPSRFGFKPSGPGPGGPWKPAP